MQLVRKKGEDFVIHGFVFLAVDSVSAAVPLQLPQGRESRVLHAA